MNNRNKKLSVFAILFLALLLFGCVEKSIYPSEKETIKVERLVDLNNDGIPDQSIFVFEEREVENVKVRREIVSKREVGNVVTVRLNIITNVTDKISDVRIQEVIPPSIATSLEKINFTTKYTEVVRKNPPITVAWDFTFTGSERVGKTIEYTTVAFQEINKDWINAFVQSPQIEVQVIDPSAVPIVFTLTSTGDSIYNLLKSTMNFYVASAVYGSMLFLAFLILVEAGSVVIAFANSMIRRSEFMEEVYKVAGHGRKDNTIWSYVGIGLIIFGAIIALIIGEVSGSEDLTTFARLGSNVLNTIGASMIFLGVVSIYYAVIDMIKGSILGERYFLSPIDTARIRVEQLIDAIEELEEEIQEQVLTGMDLETEQVVANVERKRVENISKNLNQENAEEYVKIALRAISDINASIESLRSKAEVLRSWPIWRRQIDDHIRESEQVGPEMLTGIPPRWRRWSLTKYLSEHLGEALTIEDGVLKRIKMVAVRKGEIDMILGDLLRAGKIDGIAAMRRDGLIIASMLPENIDSNIVAAIGAKVMANAEMASMELGAEKPSFVVIKTEMGDNVIYSGKNVILVALIKSGETLGFVINEMKKVLRKLNTMME